MKTITFRHISLILYIRALSSYKFHTRRTHVRTCTQPSHYFVEAWWSRYASLQASPMQFHWLSRWILAPLLYLADQGSTQWQHTLERLRAPRTYWYGWLICVTKTWYLSVVVLYLYSYFIFLFFWLRSFFNFLGICQCVNYVDFGFMFSNSPGSLNWECEYFKFTTEYVRRSTLLPHHRQNLIALVRCYWRKRFSNVGVF